MKRDKAQICTMCKLNCKQQIGQVVSCPKYQGKERTKQAKGKQQ